MGQLFFIRIGAVFFTTLVCLVSLLSSRVEEDSLLFLQQNELTGETLLGGRGEGFESLFESQGILKLEGLQLTERVPDLRKEIVAIRCNNRPDAGRNRYRVFLASGDEKSVASSEKLYLEVRRAAQNCAYYFSDTPTNLWLQCAEIPGGGGAGNFGSVVEVRVVLQNKDGKEVVGAKERSKFSVALSGDASFGYGQWEIGGDRVDASFGVKQQMRRLGPDQFLIFHGGEEFASYAFKERFDFCSKGGSRYSRYLATGDLLFWNGDSWVPRSGLAGRDPSQVPLLEVKKVDEKAAVFDIWNITGTAKQSVTLMKYQNPGLEVAEAVRDIEFVGMKSWSSAIVVFGGDVSHRLVVRPNDWLLRTAEGWEFLSSIEDIDAYVSGEKVGPLLVIEGIFKEGKNFVLRGHIFDSLRTSFEHTVFPLSGGWSEEDKKGTSGVVKGYSVEEVSGGIER